MDFLKCLNFNRKKNLKNKILAVSFFVLLLSMSAFMAAVPKSNAADALATFPTYGFITVNPQPVGIGQSLNVIFWLDSAPPQNLGAEYYGWKGLTVTITKPDGSTETRGPFESDSLGSAYLIYTPESVGKYYFQLSFPGQTVEITSASFYMALGVGTYYYKPSTSRVVEATVQTQQATAIPDIGLPPGYWTFPITAENREWYQIAGNWLSSSTGFAKYTKAPETAHILWTKQLSFGGIVGGESGYGVNYYTANPYEVLFTPPIVISGRLYYNIYPGAGFGGGIPGVVCADLRSGEELWRKENMPQISFGQTMNFKGADGYGVVAYLWSTVNPGYWEVYDAFTGMLVSTIMNVTSGTNVYGPKGELLVYNLNGMTNRLSLWNSTLAVMNGTVQWSAEAWRPPAVIDFAKGIQWEVSVPAVSGGVPSISFIDYDDGVIVAEAAVTATMKGTDPTFIHIGYSTSTGAQLWKQTRSGYNWGFSGPSMPGLIGFKCGNAEGVYTTFQKETMQWHGFNVITGEKIWSTESLSKYTNDDYSMYDWIGQVAYGKLYVTGYSGCVTAFDLHTGAHLWTYNQGSSGLTTPYYSWPSLNGVVIADNKVFLFTQEHTPNAPILKGYNLICISAINGNEIWRIPSFTTTWAVADGELLIFNDYDRQAYAFGKGETTTTLLVQDNVISNGDSVLVTGTITDQSPGAKNTPAIADSDMTAWMKYLYQQQPKPYTAKGVNVKLTAVGPNGNEIDLGTATSDINGNYAHTWTPTGEGIYHIKATFEGTNSYYSSESTTYLSVTSTSSNLNNNSNDLTSLSIIAVAALALIVAIVSILLVIMRRK